MKWVIAVFMTVMCSQPSYAFECQSLDGMLKHMLAEKHLGYLADSTDQYGFVHMYFFSRSTREWAEIMIDDNLNACLIFEGKEWNFAFERAI